MSDKNVENIIIQLSQIIDISYVFSEKCGILFQSQLFLCLKSNLGDWFELWPG